MLLVAVLWLNLPVKVGNSDNPDIYLTWTHLMWGREVVFFKPGRWRKKAERKVH